MSESAQNCFCAIFKQNYTLKLFIAFIVAVLALGEI